MLPGDPAPSFDAPLEMLHACHERIDAQCATLGKLAAHLPRHGNDTQAQQAAQAIMRYFDTAGRHHHQDEEEDLFPMLLACDKTASQALIEQIRDEHRAMEQAWQALRPALVAIASGSGAQLDTAAAEHFSKLYRDHIAHEEILLLPLAARLLSGAQQAALGHAMSKRRGVRHP
ncbi:MAG: hemerythrin domain-containing protein [Pseudomonadota bacterium]